MKRSLASVLLVVMALICVLTSCGVEKEDIIGTWVSDEFASADGNTKVFIIEFREDGTCMSANYKTSDSIPTEPKTGTYEIGSNTIRCSYEDSVITYVYKGGTLKSGSIKYSKK